MFLYTQSRVISDSGRSLSSFLLLAFLVYPLLVAAVRKNKSFLSSFSLTRIPLVFGRSAYLFGANVLDAVASGPSILLSILTLDRRVGRITLAPKCDGFSSFLFHTSARLLSRLRLPFAYAIGLSSFVSLL